MADRAFPDRACLTRLLFVLRSGIPWQMLPKELGCGSGMTCWRRLRDWQQKGVWALICDGQGVALAVRVTGANRNDSQALALVDAIPLL